MKTGHGRDLYISEALDSDDDVEIVSDGPAYINKAHAIEIIKHLATVHGIRLEEEVDHKAALAEKAAELEKARELLKACKDTFQDNLKARNYKDEVSMLKRFDEIEVYLGDKA